MRLQRKQSPQQDFQIHVDASCLSEKYDDQDKENDMSNETERKDSNQTVVHHDSWGGEGDAETPVAVEDSETVEKHEQDDELIVPEHNEQIDKENKLREKQISRIEAEIKKAAAQVVASIESDNFPGPNDSVLSAQTDEGYEGEPSEATYDGMDGTEVTYGDSTEATYESDHEVAEEIAGDSSSQHDGDIDDDIFSNSNQSKRSSLNSVQNSSSADESKLKQLTSPMVGEEAASSHESETEMVSRVPSGASFMQVPGDNELTPRTPSKVLSRPPFRTPSSIRAMQMSSPTPSIFSSPRSVKRHMPTVSRLGTPTSHSSPSKRTPTRLKPRKADPLVLLHVTLLPLQWTYSHLMSTSDFPESLQRIKESWRLLQEKVGDTVLERGVLLPHPQDSYDTLEERLLEALELPVRPRARILKCGHYMGPLDTSDDEGGDYLAPMTGADGRLEERKWCDICGRDIRLEEVGELDRGEKRFRIKIYASNGLMRAGAWVAAWKEMERVDVEIEPFVDSKLQPELDNLATITQHSSKSKVEEEHEADFEDEEIVPEHIHGHPAHLPADHEKSEEELKLEEELRQHVEKEEERSRAESRAQQEQEDELRRKVVEEERVREIYRRTATPEPRSASRAASTINEDSLSELLVAAFKVAMQDMRNVVIVGLSILLLLLVIVPRSAATVPIQPSIQVETVTRLSASPITTTVVHERIVTEMVTMAPTPVEVSILSTSVAVSEPTMQALEVEQAISGSPIEMELSPTTIALEPTFLAFEPTLPLDCAIAIATLRPLSSSIDPPTENLTNEPEYEEEL